MAARSTANAKLREMLCKRTLPSFIVSSLGERGLVIFITSARLN